MHNRPINLAERFTKFSEHGSPKIIARMNDYDLELFVIPKGVQHKTSAEDECCAMLVEVAGTVNTGAAGGEKAAPTEAWV
jgi:hypothetical protein